MSGLEEEPTPEGLDEKSLGNGRRIPKKILAIVLAVALIGVSGFYVWYEYYRHWSIGDLEDALILDEDSDEFYPVLLGFKDRFEGRTVTVDMIVRSIRSLDTNLGQLHIVYPEGGNLIGFMVWGPIDFEEDEKIEMAVTFERSVINGNEAVYSPQICLPGFGILATAQQVIHSVSWVKGEYALTIEDTGDDVVIRVRMASEPVPLGMSSCHFRAGNHTDAVELIDLLGWYSERPDVDALTNLTYAEGENGTIMFSDENDDGYLDDGDSFTLRNLIRPTTESGAQTYLLSVVRERYSDETPTTEGPPIVFMIYLIMTEKGVLVAEQTSPHGTSYLSATEDNISMTFSYVSMPIEWNETRLLITDGTRFYDFEPNASELSTGFESVVSCGTCTVEDVIVECTVTDIAGNGQADAGDKADFHALNGTVFDENTIYSLQLIYCPTGTRILSDHINFLSHPVSECFLSTTNNSTSITLTPIHEMNESYYHLIDVTWTDIAVRINDGENQVEWNLSIDDFDGGEPIDWTSDEQSLGSMPMTCTIVELQGNGLANSGDRVVLNAASGMAYDEATVYSVALVHIPTGVDIFSMVLTG